MATRKRLVPGDILEFALDGSKKSVQYLGKHPEYGGVVWVPSETGTVGYVAFYPAAAAVTQKLVEVTGQRDPATQVPTKIRRPGARSREGKIDSWVVENGGEERMTRGLTDTEKQLPIAVIWNHEMLCIRIRESWNPSQEV